MFGATSFVTTEPAPTMAPSPIVMPGSTIVPIPRNARAPMRMGAVRLISRSRFPESTLCNPVQTEVVREQEDTVADHATVSERYGPGKAKIKVCLRTHPQRTAVDFDSTSP